MHYVYIYIYMYACICVYIHEIPSALFMKREGS